MVQENINWEISAIGSDDGENTYEIRRKLGDDGKKALVIELYPTLTTDKAGCMDLSTMHLMNHIAELGWCDVRVVNLYAKVFYGKPRTSDLSDAETSTAYISEILQESDINEYDIVIAWGSALASHKPTEEIKVEILSMLNENGLASNVKCISTDGMYVEEAYYQACYTMREPLPVKHKDIRTLTLKDEEYVKLNYHMGNEAYVKERILAKVMYGAYVEDRLVGFVGSHDDGSMGMLFVEEAYRGRGIGESLEAYNINRQRENGFIPYAHIIVGNEASVHLQEKLGLYFAKDTIWWLGR